MKTKTRFQRKTNPNPMNFQRRDGEIINTIYQFDGMLTRRQIKDIFWQDASVKAMEHRLTLLFQNGYLNYPNSNQRQSHPIPESIVWLGWRGIIYIASEMQLDVEIPKTINENQLRKLEKSIRNIELRWQREPRWSQLSHDIAVNDFRISIEQACKRWPSVSLETWVPEGEFFRNMDTILVGKRKKGIRPDGFFTLIDHMRQINNSPARARFLLELDNGTHAVTRFGRDKALPGIAYIQSKEYRKRFGYSSGRWLIVCKSEQRMANLKKKTEEVLGKDAKHFLFTTLNLATPTIVLNQPIWHQGGSDKTYALFRNIGKNYVIK